MAFVDLQDALDEWPFDAEKVSVRKIRGTDGLIKIQQRVELGIVQMSPSGRPDGARPFGCDSLLAYHRQKLGDFQERNGTTVGFTLSAEECAALREEASLYYRRYVANFVLEDFQAVVRDTRHNLDVLDMVREHAVDLEDSRQLETFRPYIIMMHTRALAHLALREGSASSALAHLNRGLLTLRHDFEERGMFEHYSRSQEVRLLLDMRAKLAGEVPLDHGSRLREALRDAVDSEQFEEAARLRDELENLEDGGIR